MTQTAEVRWTKLRSGEWGVKGPANLVQKGALVLVTKRDGGTSVAIVGRVLWANDEIAIATVDERSGRSGRTYGRPYTGRYCRACGHTPDDCADMDCTCRRCGGMLG